MSNAEIVQETPKTEKKAQKAAKGEEPKTRQQIAPPRFLVATFKINGTAPYVSNKFSGEAREMMKAKQEAGSQANKKKGQREGKDFDKCARESVHQMADGGYGIPASSFRQACISACRIVGFKMTLAKLAIFVMADGIDSDDGSPLVRIEGDPKRVDSLVRNETGVADIRPRMHFDHWSATLRVRYDADLFTDIDVRNLLERVGVQVGIGAGRPDSKMSCGQGWGTFEIGE